MAKTQTAATLNPLSLAASTSIYYEDAQTVINQNSYALMHRPSYGGHVAGDTGWDGHVIRNGSATAGSGNAPRTHGVTVAAGNSWEEVANYKAYISADEVTIRFGARCAGLTAGTGTVRLTIGTMATPITLSFNSTTAPATGLCSPNTVTVATSDPGITVGAKNRFVVDMENVSGTGDIELVEWYVDGEPITSSLPSPTLE